MDQNLGVVQKFRSVRLAQTFDTLPACFLTRDCRWMAESMVVASLIPRPRIQQHMFIGFIANLCCFLIFCISGIGWRNNRCHIHFVRVILYFYISEKLLQRPKRVIIIFRPSDSEKLICQIQNRLYICDRYMIPLLLELLLSDIYS